MLDNTGTPQPIYVDGTPPAVSISAPASGGPAVIPSAFYVISFSATDNVAGFGGSNGWTLQRQAATWSGTACGAFTNDTASGNLVTGTTSGAQTSSQSLSIGKCYRWTLAASDQNGNTAATLTSGSIRTDAAGVLGLSTWRRTESWDLGGGDSLGVSVGSGNVIISHPIVSLPIRGSSTSVDLTYNSQDSSNVGFGPGWRLNVQRGLVTNADGSVTFTDADGSRHTFTNPVTVGTVTTYTRPSTLYAILKKDTALTDPWTLTYRDQSRDTFNTSGQLSRAEDRFGNGVTMAYASGRISTITDTASSPNRTIDFAYDGSNRLTSITDWAYVSVGVVQLGSTGSRRATRLFYDASSNLAGWADPANPNDVCPSNGFTGGSHITCLELTSGLVSAIVKTQTTELPYVGHLRGDIRLIRSEITYAGSDVTAVKDAEQVESRGSAATFSHPAAGATKVVRPGTPASETTYTPSSVTDSLGRVTSVKRKLGSDEIEQRTVYDSSFPTEPASVTDNYGALAGTPARTSSYAYLAGSLGLVSRLVEPLTASSNRTTDFTYDANNDVTRQVVALDGAVPSTTTRYCYDNGCALSGNPGLTRLKEIANYTDGVVGNGLANEQDVTRTYLYDAYGQKTRETRSNYNAAGTLLDSRAIGYTYDDKGNLTSEIANYVDGAVTNGTDDVTPNGTTNARTDLTTAYTYDTAGNRVSTADARRAIESAKGTSLAADDYVDRSTYDPLGSELTTVEPTTPGVADCSPTPGCRTTTNRYDELGAPLTSVDPGGLETASYYDATSHAESTYEEAAGSVAEKTSSATFDASGRALSERDRNQLADSSLGSTTHTYDELGREVGSTQASGSSPDVSSATTTAFDALDRKTSETSGDGISAAQTTTYGYDLGGRVVSTDDEFTCSTNVYDYRDLATQQVDGLDSGTCTGGTPLTATISNDGLGRVTARTVDASNQPEANTYDAAGNVLAKSGKQAGTTTSSTYTVNPLDQTTVEVRSDGSTAKTNFDAAGNATDACYWKPSITVGSCLPADTVSWTNPPTQAGTTGYDARNQRISLTSRLGSTSTVATTTYDPANNYQIGAFYLPTGPGKEAQDVYGYDTRHRLSGITHQVCTISSGHSCSSTVATGSSTYAYDDNDNRTSLTESSTGGAAVTRNYCYDALNRLRAEKTGAACTTTSGDETYTYDDAGNRLAATVSASTRSFTYNSSGQLASCSSPTCSVTYDDAGRSLTFTDNGVAWTYAYDADDRLIGTCRGTSCTGSGFDRLDYLYDGAGHRTQIKETSSTGTVTTTDLRYEGDTIVQELTNGTVSRTYATDDTGRIVEVCDPDCSSGTIYLVAWNGHGDATGLWRKNADGSLTLANSYTYSTWGTPTTTIAGGFSDLGFRFLYVGASDVQWDNAPHLASHPGLLYMHARTYSPILGRFLQPDPARQDTNAYVYVEGNPVTNTDPGGTFVIYPGGLPPWLVGRLFEVYVGFALRDAGWRIVGRQVRFDGGRRIMDYRIRGRGTTLRIEAKWNNSRYTVRQRAADLKARAAGEKTIIVRGKPGRSGRSPTLRAIDPVTGEDVTRQIFGRYAGGYELRGGGGGRPNLY